MSIFVGLDGYPKGWIAVWLYEDRQEIEYIECPKTIGELSKRDFTTAMVDMPIGLPEYGRRDCDLAARELLKPNQSRVFLDARRCWLDCENQPSASAKAKSIDSKGVSTQLFGIGKKLREIDAIATPQLQQRLKECHPELVFWRLNGRRSFPKKDKEPGRTLRRELLKREGFHELDKWLNDRWGRGVAIDDVLDACACAIAARDKTASRPPLGGDVDDKGLRMEIHY